jgi:hypothetical protein
MNHTFAQLAWVQSVRATGQPKAPRWIMKNEVSNITTTPSAAQAALISVAARPQRSLRNCNGNSSRFKSAAMALPPLEAAADGDEFFRELIAQCGGSGLPAQQQQPQPQQARMMPRFDRG